MTLAQGAVFVGLVVLVVELLRGKRAPAVVFAGVAFGFVLMDFISVSEGLRQLANPGLATVVVLLLLSVVLDRSRLLEVLAQALVRGPYRWALAKLCAATALYSAFLNNTAVVASLIGPLRTARAHAPSRLLMPMCFAATLGGTLTLVGTSTNLLVNSLMIGQQIPPLHIFDLFPVGLLILLGCTVTMVLLYPRLLPAQPPAEDPSSDYFLEATVRADSPLVGRSVEAGGLRRLAHLFLAEIVRQGRVMAPVQPEQVIEAGDLLVFTGDVTRLDLLMRIDGLETHGQHYRLPLDNLVEVVIAAHAPLARRTLKQTDFRSRFDAAVIAIRRGSERLRGPLADVPLEVGDTLVLVVGPDFDKRNNLQRNFVIVSRRQVQKFTDARKGLFATAGFVVAIALSALGWVDFLKSLLVLLAVFLASGLTRPAELRRNMPYGIIIIIGASLVISQVMVQTGAAALLAGGLLSVVHQLGPYGALALILLGTWVLTELMTNNAAAALAFPVALGVAQQTGLDPRPFAMAVLYGASCSFLTPYGYQTNLMVMSPGRYTLRDFLRAGLPLGLVYQGIALVSLPLFFPFSH